MSEASVTKALADGKRTARVVMSAFAAAEERVAQAKSLGLYIRQVRERADIEREAQ